MDFFSYYISDVLKILLGLNEHTPIRAKWVDGVNPMRVDQTVYLSDNGVIWEMKCHN